MFITLGLTGVVWLAQSLRFVDLIVNRGLSVSLFLYLTTLLMPSLLMVVIPVALFCGIMYVYHKLIGDSELIVLESAGLNKWQLARPAMQLAVFLMLIGYAISLYIMPASFREFKDMQFFIRNNYASLLLQEGVFNTPTKGLTVYIRKRESDGALRGLMVHDNSDPLRPVTMMAKRGYMVNTANGPRIILEQGNRQEVNHNSEQLSILDFERYTLNLSVYTGTDDIRWREPQERYVHELFSPEDTPKHQHPKLWAEAHQRLSWPLYTPALAMIALAGLLSGQFNRRGQWRRIFASAAVMAATIAVAISLQNIVTRYSALAPLMYAVPLLLMGASGWVIRHKTYDAIPPSAPNARQWEGAV